MKKLIVLPAIFLATMLVSLLQDGIFNDYHAQAAAGSSPKIGPETVWVQPADIIKHQKEVDKDLYGYMKRNGASPQAIDFARRMEGEILTKFREDGQSQSGLHGTSDSHMPVMAALFF